MNALKAIENPRYAADFKAGFLAAREASQEADVNTLDSTAGKKAYSRVSKLHGFTWLDGWCAVIDSSRGAYAMPGVKAAVELGLVMFLYGQPWYEVTD